MKSYTLKELVLMREEASDRIRAANLLPSDETTAALAVEKMRFYCESDVAPLVEALRKSRRELQSCQAVIHLHGGFDQNYVYAAQESLRETDAILSALDADGSKS